MSTINKFKVFSENLQRDVDITTRYPNENIKANNVNYLYMHDGQNAIYDSEAIFGKSWDIDSHLTSLEMEGEIPPTILITIDCNQVNDGFERFREFSIFENNWVLADKGYDANKEKYSEGILKPRGDKYLKFIVEELMPKVESDQEVNVRAMLGSSMGGLITHCAGIKYPQLFDVLLCISNAYWYCDQQMIEYIKNENINRNQLYYMDVGTAEESLGLSNMNEIYVSTNKAVVAAMEEKTDNITFAIIDGGVHNEANWSKRIKPIMAEFLKERNVKIYSDFRTL